MALLSNIGPSGVSNTGTYNPHYTCPLSNSNKCIYHEIRKLNRTTKVYLANRIHLEKLWGFIWYTHLKILDQFHLDSSVLCSDECLVSIFVCFCRMQDLRKSSKTIMNANQPFDYTEDIVHFRLNIKFFHLEMESKTKTSSRVHSIYFKLSRYRLDGTTKQPNNIAMY